MAKNFTEAVLAGEANIDDIDDYVDRWHRGIDHIDLVPLWLYLGMSRRQYARWVEDPDSLAGTVEFIRKQSRES